MVLEPNGYGPRQVIPQSISIFTILQVCLQLQLGMIIPYRNYVVLNCVFAF